MTARLVIVLSLAAGGCDLAGSSEVHAVGSRAYHAAPEACSIEQDDAGVLAVVPHHDRAADGKGIVFEAMHPGEATLRCGKSRTTIVVREAERIELRRVDGGEAPVTLGDLYAPTICLRAFDRASAPLLLGTLTQGIHLETSAHLDSIDAHGGGLSPDATCTRLQHPEKAGQAEVRASWRGLTARHAMRIAAP